MRKIFTRKRILILCLISISIAVFAVILLFHRSNQEGYKENSPEGIASKFIEYVYNGDIEGIRSLMPEDISMLTLENTKELWGLTSDEEALEYQGSSLNDYLDNLDATFVDWDMEYEIQEITPYSDEELKETNMLLRMMDSEYQAKKAAKVTVQISFLAVNGTEGSVTLVVPVYRSGSIWSLGQYIGSAIPDTDGIYTSWFGDLMDGAYIVGYFDENGNRVYYDEEGYEMTEQEDGSWIGYDEYGNIRYYDENQELTKVTGPNGGDALTEETYIDFYENQ